MKTLTLQITRDNFVQILNGEQKVETRAVLPNVAKRYVDITDNSDGSIDVSVIEYEALLLINGRQKDSPRLTVEVTESKIVYPLDEDGNSITYEENGEEYVSCWMEYKLGNVLNSINADKFK